MPNSKFTPDTKLIIIPTDLRIEVPIDMSDEDIASVVRSLSYGDFAIYPDDASGSLKKETLEHILTREETGNNVSGLVKQISTVDLWSNEHTFSIVNF